MSHPKLASFPKENDGDGRYYKHPLTGEKLASVTSILKMADKSGLAQWAADQAILWSVENWHLLGSRSPEDAYKAGRFRWNAVRDERAQVGTGVHETVQAIHTGSWDYPVLDEEQKRIMGHWEMLNNEHEIKPLLTEFTCWNPGVSAGTADGYWLIDGVKTLVDIKTSKNMWPEHNYQLAALWASPWVMEEYELDKWRENYAPTYEEVAIIHLREDRHEIHRVSNLQLNYDAFKGYVDVRNAKEAIKQADKDAKVASFGGFA